MLNYCVLSISIRMASQYESGADVSWVQLSLLIDLFTQVKERWELRFDYTRKLNSILKCVLANEPHDALPIYPAELKVVMPTIIQQSQYAIDLYRSIQEKQKVIIKVESPIGTCLTGPIGACVVYLEESYPHIRWKCCGSHSNNPKHHTVLDQMAKLAINQMQVVIREMEKNKYIAPK